MTATLIALDSIAACKRASSPAVGAEQRRVEALDEALKRFIFRLKANDDRVEHRDVECAATVDGLFNHPVEENLPRPQRMILSLCGFQRILQSAHFPLGDRDDDFFLRFELAVYRRLRHTHLVGDHLQ